MVQVLVLRVWFVIIVVGMCLLVVAPITYVVQQILIEVQERVNRPPSTTSISRSISVPIPFGIDEEPIALPDGLRSTIASGEAHTCAVSRAAYVLCWGDNSAGQRGLGVPGDTPALRASISPVVGLTDVSSVALGVAHSCALRALDKSVWCWGDNQYRQLGSAQSGPQTSRAIAAPVILVPAAQQLVSGANHACLLSVLGEIWCWGDNQYGQIAQPETNAGVAPVRVEGLPNDIVAIRAGRNHTCALSQRGSLWCWGHNQSQQIDDSTDQIVFSPRTINGDVQISEFGLAQDTTCIITTSQQVVCRAMSYTFDQRSITLANGSRLESAPLGQHCVITREFVATCWDAQNQPLAQNVNGIAATSSGADFGCVLLRAGLVQCRGDNQRGQIGVADSTKRLDDFVFVTLGSSNDVIAAGYAHVCTIWQLGKVLCWGRNLEGQIGLPVQDSIPFSAIPNEIDINGVTHIVTSGNHSCGIRYDGRVSCWGLNRHGQLGVGHANIIQTPEVIHSLTDVAQISVGLNHSCALQRDGQVFCWGDNRFGQTAGSALLHSVPVLVRQVRNVVKIATGGNTSCALQNDSSLICWGAPIGGMIDFAPLTQISDVVDFAISTAHACALQSEGDVYCWGDHQYQNSVSLAVAPTRIAGLPPVRALALGSNHTCVLDAQHDVWCWGQNGVGQVNGVPSTTLYATPELQYRGTSHVVAGHDFTCVRQQIGATVCWGNNRYGQLGIDNRDISFHQNTAVNDGFVLASGGTHSCVLLAGSTTRCWGGNEYGQLGDGTINTSAVPQSVRSNESFVAIDAGLAHTCAIVNDATVRCWGHNNFGQLGDVTTENTNAPVVAAVQGVRKLALGNSHSCGLLTDGGSACWGRNDDGQLGVGGTANSAMPLRVASLEQAVDIASGADHVCVVRQDGTVWCWGSNTYGQLGIGEAGPGVSIPTQVLGIFNAVAVSLGDTHSCVLSADSTVWCWGWNNFGQVGASQIDAKSIAARPQQVSGLANVVQLYAGGNHNCVLTKAADAFCWGDNFNGQLGNPLIDAQVRNEPIKVAGITRFANLAAGGAHTCGLLQDGDVLCWGWNQYGQIGNGIGGNSSDVLIPSPVITLTDVNSVAVGARHVCAGAQNRDVVCWGDNDTGQLGTGLFGDGAALTVPQRVDLIVPGLATTVGANHACALLSSTELSCWGSNEFGQIGNGFAGSIANTAVPNFVSGLIGVSNFASGGNANCAIVIGEVYCWGDNQYGQIGQPTVGIGDIRVSPTKVPLLADMRAVVVGKNHACALSNTGLVYCWGRNNQSQLGGFEGELSATPMLVQNISDVAQISAGDDHTCAVTTQSTLFCWGSNSAGQRGVINIEQRTLPNQVEIPAVQQVTTGASHTCAFDGNTVICWGSNDHGQLGNGASSDDPSISNNRVAVAGLPQVQSIHAGGNRSCAVVTSNRELWCWGQNENAQLGVTNNPDVNAPVAVIDLWSMQATTAIIVAPTTLPTPRLPIPTITQVPTSTPAPTATLIRPQTP
jgi:alpha-tubulin suppressor-like RCC1 family protein